MTGADDSVEQILERLAEQMRGGKLVNLDEIVAEHPAYEEQLRRLLPVLFLLEGAGAQATPAGPSHVAPEQIGAYRVVREIGRGGMGRVFECRGKNDERVAIKVIHPHLVTHERHRERFLREADVGRGVSHPSIVSTLGAATADLDGVETPYIVLEYVQGQTLRQLLDEVGVVPERLVRFIGERVASALATLHAEGVTHRDVKPENVVITSDETVKLMDLGVALLTEQALRLSRTGEFVGSLLYAAPEQIHGGAQGPATDLYALGLLLFELSAGEHPFRRNPQGAVEGAVPSLSAIRANVSAFLSAIVQELLAPDAGRRFESAQLLAEVLRDGDESDWWKSREVTPRWHPTWRRGDDDIRLHGRDDELARLDALLERAEAGDGAALVVEGEAGVGKSRMVMEWLTRLERRSHPPRVTVAACSSDASVGTAPLATAMRVLVGAMDIEERVNQLLDTDAPLVQILSEELRDGSTSMTPTARATAYQRLLSALAREQPLVFVIEDLQFGGEGVWELFIALARTAPGQRVCVVGTTRPDVSEKIRRSATSTPETQWMTLSGLDAASSHALLREVLGRRAAGSTGAADLIRAADGNPFCLLEFGREQRRQRKRVDTSKGAAAGIRVPDSLRALVEDRLAGIDSEARELLSVAACCGAQYDPELICDVLEMPRLRGLRRFLSLDQENALVSVDGDQYRFRHHLVQEMLYEDIPPALRRSYHTSLARELERRSTTGDRRVSDRTARSLLRHFLYGDEIEAAVPYLRQGLEALQRSGDTSRMIKLARLIDEQHERVPRSLHVSALAILADGLLSLDSVSEAHDASRRAWALSTHEDPAARATVATGYGIALRLLGRQKQSIQIGEQAVTLAREADDAGVLSDALGRLALVYMLTGRTEHARTSADEALQSALSTTDFARQSSAARHLGVIEMELSNLERGRELLEFAERVARAHGHRDREADATHALGLVARMEGRIDDAVELTRRNREQARSLGLSRMEAVAWANYANALLDVGRAAEGEAEARAALAFGATLDHPFVAVHGNAVLSNALERVGRLSEAATAMAGSLERAEPLKIIPMETAFRSVYAGQLAWLGRCEEAEVQLERTKERAGAGATPLMRAHMVIAEAKLLESRQRPAEALEILSERIDAIGTRELFFEMRLRLLAGRLALACDAPDEARRHLDDVLADARRLGLEGVTAHALLLRGGLPDEELLPAYVSLEEQGEALPIMERMLCSSVVGRARADRKLVAQAHSDLALVIERVDASSRAAMEAMPFYRAIRETP